PRDTAAARAAQRSDLAALAAAGVPAAAIDTAPIPDTAAFPSALTGPGEAREQLAWRVRATAGVTTVLGLQVIAGTGLDGAPGAGRLAGLTPVLLTSTAAEGVFGTYDTAVGKTIQIRDFGPGQVVGVVRDFAFRGAWVPAEASAVVIAAEPVTEQELIYVMRAPDSRRAPLIEAATAALAGTGDAD